MVCSSCEKKLSKVIVPDKWKEGARNVSIGSSRQLGENKLLSSGNKSAFSSYSNKCKLCNGRVHQDQANYCQACAYKRGICAICGIQIINVKMYRQNGA